MLQKKTRYYNRDISDKDNIFKYLFLAFDASQMAFYWLIRPMLTVDVTGKDGSNQSYSLAFGILI